MKVTVLGPIAKSAEGHWQAPISLFGRQTVPMDLDATYDPASPEPTKLWGDGDAQTWAYRGTALLVKDADALSLDQLKLEVRHAVLRVDKRYARLNREIEAFENLDRTDVARRERIPDSVRLFVWQRDHGICVRCGSCTRLEFDHVIPIAKGGSNTDRNIQLLCEVCNRSKGADI